MKASIAALSLPLFMKQRGIALTKLFPVSVGVLGLRNASEGRFTTNLGVILLISLNLTRRWRRIRFRGDGNRMFREEKAWPQPAWVSLL